MDETVIADNQPEAQAVGFRDSKGRLQQWELSHCECYPLRDGRIYQRGKIVIYWSAFNRMTGRIAECIGHNEAAELLLGSGYRLPPELTDEG